MREIELITCSCGGTPVVVPQTTKEKWTMNCPKGCCGYAIECPQCKTRFNIRLESPEYQE
jgi:hypothetical protein